MSNEMNNQVMDRELGWDEPIERDYESSFVLLPDGDYDFEVISFERGRYPGSNKPNGLPACNKAVLTIEVGGDQAAARITHNLFLHSRTEGMLCAFFTSIGQRKHGDKLIPNWGAVVGSKGRCKVIVDTFTKKDGSEGKSNKITKFYEPEEGPWPAAGGKSFQEGMF